MQGPRRLMPRFGLRSIFVATSIASALLVLILNYFPIGVVERSVCSECGAVLRTTHYRLPFTYKQIYTRSQRITTPISDALADHNLTGNHEHEWQFVESSGFESDGEFFQGCGSTEYLNVLYEEYADDVSTLLDLIPRQEQKVLARCVLSPETVETSCFLFEGSQEEIQRSDYSAGAYADLCDVKKLIAEHRDRLSMSREQSDLGSDP